MSTKTIANTYIASGYSLSPSYGTLVIASSATIGGTGVLADGRATIDNLGAIRSKGTTGQGLALYDGGSVTNGSTADTTALIEGTVGITLSRAGNVTNYGTIQSTGTAGRALALDGGSVTNFGRIDGAVHFQTSGTIVNGSTIDGTALIDGSAVGTKISNYGTIDQGPGATFALSGLQISNGSAIDPTARIEGAVGVVKSGTLDNFGTIEGRIRFTAGGTLVNGSTADWSALIEGPANQVAIADPASILNYGTISALLNPFGRAVIGETVTNGAPTDRNALIDCGPSGVYAGSLVNFGTIEANAADRRQRQAALISGIGTNGSAIDRTALIRGANGVSSTGTLTNYGQIVGWGDGTAGGAGVVSTGTVVNGSAQDLTADISGTEHGVSGATLVANYGTIWGGHGAGAYKVSRLVNGSAADAGALVHDGAYRSATITNFGTIGAGAHGTAVLLVDHTDLLVVEAHSMIEGKAVGAGGTLALAGAAGAGSIGGLGTRLTDFGVIKVEAGATWTLTGTNTAAGLRLVDFGTLSNGGSLIGGVVVENAYFWNQAGHAVSNAGIAIAGAPGHADTVGNVGKVVSSGGIAVDLAGGGWLTNGSSKVATSLIEGTTGVVLGRSGTITTFGTIDGTGGTAVDFTGSADVLLVEATAVFKGALAGFRKTDAIDLAGFAVDKAEKVRFVENAAKTGGTLTITEGAKRRSIELLGQFAAAGFHHASDGHGGTSVTYTPPAAAPPALAPPGV